jgi:tetratricopeptide (TPR) repeat protein
MPPDTPDFTGRAEQVDFLQGILGAEPASARPGALIVSAIVGMGGVGKTALAVHAAHHLRDRFTDGQLHVNLQGTSSPLRPGDVLARFLRDLGVPDSAIPAGEADRASRYRTLLATRKMLVVLDDARDAAQVRPLLPGSASCGVIVTSRNTLPGLAGATHLKLDVMPSDEARAMFTMIAGKDRIVAEPVATRAVLAHCAGLPLAIRIAASRLVSRPGWSVDYLRTKLADERSRLGELTAGDLAVRASFAVSYNALPRGGADPARVFRLLGLTDATVLSLPAVAAMAGQPAEQAAAALETLVDAHLLESPSAERYRLHDLLRSYAGELGTSTDAPGERDAAIQRVLGWYSQQAEKAARALSPHQDGLPESASAQRSDLIAMTSPVQALDWFEDERANLLSAVRQAPQYGMHHIAVQISDAMWGFFQRTSYAEDWLAANLIGVAAARHQDDDALLCRLLNGLGQVQSFLGHFADARRSLTEALAIRRRMGDRTGEAKVLNSLGIDLLYQKRYEDALVYLREGKAIHAGLGDQANTGIVLNNIGYVLLLLKRYDEAIDQLQQALTMRQASGSRYGEGITESTLGGTYLAMGYFEDAAEHYTRARAALRDTAPDQDDENADVLCGLGDALAALGRITEACRAWQAAIPHLDRLGDPRTAELRQRLAAHQ